MGGGSTTSTGTTYTSNLPEYAKPYFQTLMNRAETESQRNPADFVYAADRTANTTADTTAAAAATRAAFTNGDPPEIHAARLAAAQAGGVSQGLSQFQGANVQSAYTAPPAYAGKQFRSTYTAPPAYAGAQFQGADFRSDYTAPTPYTGAQFDPRMIQAASVSAQPFTGEDAARYMSPYMQQVVNRQTEAAQRAFDEGQGARDQNAISKGAFGGYRNAIQEGVAQRGLQTQKGDIQAAGSQAAYQQAQAQFNADQLRQLQAGTTTAGYGMTAQSANQQADLDAQKAQEMSRQYGSTTGSQQQQFASTEAMRAALATDASRAQAQGATEASRQYGATLGSQQQQFAATEAMRAAQATDASRIAAAGVRQQGGAMALNQAQMSAGLAESSQKLEQSRTAAMAAQGTAQQEYAQKDMDIAYNNFLVQRDFEAQRLQQFGGLLRGVPVSANTTMQQNSSSNPLAQVAGLGPLALGLSRMS